MVKDNTITTSWSQAGGFVLAFFVIGGFLAASSGLHLTWGEIVFILFILTFFLNKKRNYSFTDSGFTVRWMLCRRTIAAEEIRQIEFFGTKSGTWILIALKGAPAMAPGAGPAEILSYRLKNPRRSFLIPLQWGQRDQALGLLRKCYPHDTATPF